MLCVTEQSYAAKDAEAPRFLSAVGGLRFFGSVVGFCLVWWGGLGVDGWRAGHISYKQPFKSSEYLLERICCCLSRLNSLLHRYLTCLLTQLPLKLFN